MTKIFRGPNRVNPYEAFPDISVSESTTSVVDPVSDEISRITKE